MFLQRTLAALLATAKYAAAAAALWRGLLALRIHARVMRCADNGKFLFFAASAHMTWSARKRQPSCVRLRIHVMLRRPTTTALPPPIAACRECASRL
jgi:hypothetical protein